MDVQTTDVVVKKSFYSTVVKRFLDIVLSGFALIVLSPLLLVIYILELIFHGRPALYKTRRPGKDGKIFELYKFRSMTNERGEDGLLLPEDQRLTKLGWFLRKTSLDELPELINILKGDMSIIGPRPLLIEYLELYTPRHAMRHSVRPGLACVSLNSGTTLTWGEQFENDIYYVEHVSLLLDIKTIFAVIREVFCARDSRANDTRVPFNGENLDDTRSKQEAGLDVHFESILK